MENKIEIIGLCATIGGMLWTYYQAKDEKKAIIIANVALLGICTTLLISFRFSLIPDIQSKLKENESLLKNPRACELVKTVINGIEIAEKSPDNLMRDYAIRSQQDFLDAFEDFTKQKYTVDSHSLLAFSQNYIQTANKELIATSYVVPNKWWEGEEGHKYHEANRQLIENKVHITRYFIVDDRNELKIIKDLIQKQIDIGVSVYVIVKNEQLRYTHTEDIILIDNIKGGRLVLSSDRQPIKAEMTTLPEDIEKIKRTINNIAPFAIEGKRILNDIKP